MRYVKKYSFTLLQVREYNILENFRFATKNKVANRIKNRRFLMAKAIKKIAIIIMALTMLIGVFALSGCDNISLADYKVTGKAEIDVHVATKTQSDYSTENWTAVLAAAEAGKQAVEEATTKPQVDTAVEKTKESIDMGIYEIEVDDMVDCTKFHYSAIMSSLGYPIELQNSDENAVFECIVNKGSFIYSDEVKTITVKSGESFYWRNTDDTNKDERIFVEVFLRSDNNIIGYALVEIYQYSEPHAYKAKLLKSAFLPQIDGEYQQITHEQVKAVIEQAKSAK